jgi:DNA polymerase-4
MTANRTIADTLLWYNNARKNSRAGKGGTAVHNATHRVILHCDCNAFYASVEAVDRPELKSVPMAVCGDPKSRHGIILAKNELAKACGIQTAETLASARRKCPDLVTVPPHHEKYAEFSRRINQLYESYTDRVEAFSIDESWLDATGCLRNIGTGEALGDLLRKRVREEIGVTISVGVSFNKTFAKMGSDYKKPDATTSITPDNFRHLLWPLPARHMLFVGKVASDILARAGIRTIGDLAGAPKDRVVSLLGRSGAAAWERANGIDDEPVKFTGQSDPVKSIGNSITFARDLVGAEDIRVGLLMLCDQVGTRLRRQKVYCGTVQIQIKDPSFRTIQRQKKLQTPTNSTKELLDCAVALVRQSWSMSAPIRLLSVTATGLTEDRIQQLSWLNGSPQERDRHEKLESAVDRIREKYGTDMVTFGSTMQTDIIRREDADGEDVPET